MNIHACSAAATSAHAALCAISGCDGAALIPRCPAGLRLPECGDAALRRLIDYSLDLRPDDGRHRRADLVGIDPARNGHTTGLPSPAVRRSEAKELGLALQVSELQSDEFCGANFVTRSIAASICFLLALT